MSMEEVERFLNNFVVALQLALGVWQFMKLTPIGALIQGVIRAYMLRPFRLSTTYGRLRDYDGRVFKRANCYVLQSDIASERTIVMNESNTFHLYYLGTKTTLQRRGKMLFINNKMRYYIVPTVWDELKTLESVLRYSAAARAAATAAAAAAAAAVATAARAAAAAERAAANAAERAFGLGAANAAASAAAVRAALPAAAAAAAEVRIDIENVSASEDAARAGTRVQIEAVPASEDAAHTARASDAADSVAYIDAAAGGRTVFV